MKHLIKYTSVILLMTLAAALFQSCKKDPETPKTHKITTFDALKYFQNSIIRVDSSGNFKYRAFGEPLYANDTAHLYIGVDSLAQAEQFFRQWIAPDVVISENHGNLTCPLTDENGNAQGTVYFRPTSSSGHIAEVSVSSDTRLLYFRQITFMHKDHWPLSDPESKWHKFDIVHNLDISIKDHLKDNDKSLNWVCVRESSPGVPAMFCTVTNSIYGCYDYTISNENRDHLAIRESNFCPPLSAAPNIGNILQQDWDLFSAVFHEATGNYNLGTALWVDETHVSWFERFYSVFFYHSNEFYGEAEGGFNFLLKIDWLNNEDIYDGAHID